MKRYLTAIFCVLAALSVIIGYRFDVRWNGIVAWGFAFIFMVCATYSIRFIEEDEERKKT